MSYTTRKVDNSNSGSTCNGPFRGHKGRRLRVGVLPAAALLTAVMTAGPAFADNGQTFVNSVNPTNIEVNSDGSTYTGPAIPLVSLSAQLSVFVDAGTSGKVKSWKAWTTVKADNGFTVSFSNHTDQASYNLPRPKTVNTVAVINVPFGSIEPFATGHCNILANTLRGQGLSNGDIFAQDRVIPVNVQAAMTYETTGIGGTPTPQEVSSGKNFNLVCKASDPQRVPPTASDPTRTPESVDQATVTVHEVATLGGACKLKLSGVIVTKEPNKQVKFRYKDDAGNQSDVKTVNTDHSSTVFFNHQYSLFGGGHKTGKVRIAIVDENVSSPWSNYDVNCVENAGPGGVVQDGGVQVGEVGRGAATNLKPQDPIDPDGPIPSKPALGKTTGAATTRPGGPGAKTADLGQPDLMATTLGMSIAGGPNPWGSTVVISNPAHASAIGVGRSGNMCRFDPVSFRPFNKGTVASGLFKMAVLRNNSQVHTANFNIQPKTGLPANAGWYKFNLDLAQGMNVIKIVMDANKTVAESDEGNNEYTLRVRVNFPCTPARLKAPTRRTPGATPPREPGKTIIVPLPNLKTR